ncbi:MAG: serine/threonine-protein kinase [Gemmatimonadaceae bacterium]|nr:serine/threonine-protein kinase [Gemmatimonadaceae bacterium]
MDRLAAAVADRYRLEKQLGQGGMATVYLAQDLKHERKVAIKVLKPELAAVLGAERFVTEIKTTAALQHPHILPLFDSGEAAGFLFYVMPFIQGETLRDRLNRETQLDVDEALRITRDVADALDYAHRQGVIHRDIKPENILLHDGRPMVADFGIALAVSAAAGGRMTETGLSLGTPHYMSPEQATAEKEITGRSDIYSLASVCYEMLAGQPPHLGGSAQQIVMKIIAETAQPVTALRRTVPAHVSAALAKALEKLPADRFATAKAFADALADEHFTTRTTAGTATASRSADNRLVMVLGAALVLAVAFGIWGAMRPGATPQPSAYAVALPNNAQPTPNGFVVLSPDASRIIYLGPSENGRAERKLWMKRRDAVAPVAITDTDAANAAAISPDGKQLAYVTGDFIRRMAVDGRTSSIVATGVANVPYSVSWQDDTTLVYIGGSGQSLMRVGQSGGTPATLMRSDSLQFWGVSSLPGRRGILMMGCLAPCDRSDVWILDADGENPQVLAEDRRIAVYLEGGALLSVNRSAVATVQPLDLRSRTVNGPEVAVMDSIAIVGSTVYLAVSRNGTLVTRRGSNSQMSELELAFFDRRGREERPDTSFTFRVTQFAGDHGWSLSPDGRRLAIGLNTGSGDDVWVKSLPRGPAQRITFSTQAERRPRWSPDGRYVTYVMDDGIHMRRADGTGGDSLLIAERLNEGAISPDGKWLVLRRGALGAVSGGRDIYGVRLDGDTTRVPLIVTPYDENAFMISPDGRWIAYESDETGRQEIFVRPFPETRENKVQVSVDGAITPAWSRDGRELYFVRARDNVMMAARVQPGPEFRTAAAESLFVLPQATSNLLRSWYTPYDVMADGRFILVRAGTQVEYLSSRPIEVFENWWDPKTAALRR